MLGWRYPIAAVVLARDRTQRLLALPLRVGGVGVRARRSSSTRPTRCSSTPRSSAPRRRSRRSLHYGHLAARRRGRRPSPVASAWRRACRRARRRCSAASRSSAAAPCAPDPVGLVLALASASRLRRLHPRSPTGCSAALDPDCVRRAAHRRRRRRRSWSSARATVSSRRSVGTARPSVGRRRGVRRQRVRAHGLPRRDPARRARHRVTARDDRGAARRRRSRRSCSATGSLRRSSRAPGFVLGAIASSCMRASACARPSDVPRCIRSPPASSGGADAKRSPR